MTPLDLPVARSFPREVGFPSKAPRPAARQKTPAVQPAKPSKRASGPVGAPARPAQRRWYGYWSVKNQLFVSDGQTTIAVRPHRAWVGLVTMIWWRHYVGTQGTLPFIGSQREPSHMLLHDLQSGQLFIEALEHAEAVLAHQSAGDDAPAL